jgi:cold shock CspA family protein
MSNIKNDKSMGEAFMQRRIARQQQQENNSTTSNDKPPSLVEIQAQQEREISKAGRPRQSQQVRRSGSGVGGGRRNSRFVDMPIEQGVICSIKDSFGFIYCADREGEIFFHFSEVLNCHPADLVVDDEVEFHVGYAKGGDKMAAYEVFRLDRGTIVWETEDEPGHLFQGVVEKPVRVDRSGNVQQEGVIRLLEHHEGDDEIRPTGESKTQVAATGPIVHFSLNDYQPPEGEEDAEQSSNHESNGRAGNFRRSSSTASNSSSRERRLGVNDLVEFRVVTSRRNQAKYARNIRLLQSDRERQKKIHEEKLLAQATVEQGVVSALKDGFGFLKSKKRREEVYFHYSHVDLDDTEDDKEHELKVGQDMEFLVLTEQEGSGGRRERLSARSVKFLPKGTVEFHRILAQGVTGTVTRCPHPHDAGHALDLVGLVRLTNPILDQDDEGNEKEVKEINFFSADSPGGKFDCRDGAKDLWVREGDTLLFDVAKESVDSSLLVYPTRKQVGGEDASEESPRVKLVACALAGRAEGTINVIKDQFGFIHCAERMVDSYFRLYEVFPDEIQRDLLLGMGIKPPKKNLRVIPGAEIQFDLSVQRLTGNVKSKNSKVEQNIDVKESLKSQRILIMPQGSVMASKVIAEGAVGVVQKEDPKQQYAGMIELDEVYMSMTPEERHPLVAQLMQSLLDAMDSSDAKSLVFHDVQSIKEDDVVIEMADHMGQGRLKCAQIPVAGHDHGRLCITWGHDEINPELDAEDHEDDGDTDHPQTSDDAESGEVPASTSSPSKKKHKKKRRPRTREVKVVRYDKHCLAKELHDGPPPCEGDKVACDIIQSRRSGAVQLVNVRIVERKTPVAALEESRPSGETGIGIVTEVVAARQFGFITLLDEGASKREILFFHFKHLTNNIDSIKKGDEAKFIIVTQKGKRTAVDIEIVPRGTLDIPSKAAKNACHGFVLMEPSHSSLKDTPERSKNRSRANSLSPARGGGRWSNVDLDDSKSRNVLENEEGYILLIKDPADMFSPKRKQAKHMASGESTDSDAIDTSVQERKEMEDNLKYGLCIRLPYKSGAIAIHGAGSTSVSDTKAQGPRRGDLVSFVKANSGRGVRDVRVVAKGAGNLVRGCLVDVKIQRDSHLLGTANFVAATDGEEVCPIELSEVISCDVSLLKEKEAVEGLLHEGKIYGVCRTRDLFLESKLGVSHKERPKLNLTVRKAKGGKIMAQSGMAKGPDGTNGFAKGWTTRLSKYNSVPDAS